MTQQSMRTVGCFRLASLTGTYLDMAYASESRPFDWNEEALDAERFHSLMNEYYAEQSIEELAAAKRAILEAVANGTTHIRTHAMVDLDPGVDTLRALLEAREATSHLADVQIVPYASRGILADGNEQLVRGVIELGLDEVGADTILLGGVDPAGRNRAVELTLDRWFEVATDYDVDLDAHLQDGGSAGTYVLEQLLDRIDQYDYEGRVTASHGFCLGHVPEWRAVELGGGGSCNGRGWAPDLLHEHAGGDATPSARRHRSRYRCGDRQHPRLRLPTRHS